MIPTSRSDVFQTEQGIQGLHIPAYGGDVHEPTEPTSSGRVKTARSYKNSGRSSPYTSQRISTARVSRRIAPRRLFVPRKTNPASDLLIHERSSDIERISTKILLNEPITETDPTILGLVIVDLQNRMKRLEDRGQFKESLHVQECIEKTRDARLEAAKLEVQKYAKLDIEVRKGHSETDASIFQHTYEAEVAQINVRFDRMRRNLLNRQEEEMQDNEKLWHTDSKNRAYMHLSPKLRGLRDMQDKLVSAKRYDEAAAIGKEADDLERVEEQEMIQKRDDDYRKSVENLRKKHSEEIEILEDTRESKLNLLKKSTDNGKNVLKNRRRALKYNEDIANDKEKLWKLKHRNDTYFSRVLASEKGVRKNTKNDIYNVEPKCPQLKLPPLSLRYGNV